jgi:Xaa-Pro aminopeptidase
LVAQTDFTLIPGMVLAIEPTVADHADGVRTLDADGYAVGVQLIDAGDGSSMRTVSGRHGCSVESTLVVTATGCERLDEASASTASRPEHTS